MKKTWALAWEQNFIWNRRFVEAATALIGDAKIWVEISTKAKGYYVQLMDAIISASSQAIFREKYHENNLYNLKTCNGFHEVKGFWKQSFISIRSSSQLLLVRSACDIL